MRVNLTRIAVAQLGCIFYCMGAAALAGKLAGLSGFAPRPLAAFVRNYGLLLTLIPVVWLMGSLLLQRRTNADDTELAVLFFSGWGLTLGFFVFALWLTFAPLVYTSKTTPPQRSEQFRGQQIP